MSEEYETTSTREKEWLKDLEENHDPIWFSDIGPKYHPTEKEKLSFITKSLISQHTSQ
jgi:hypothetical protein